MTIRTEFKVGFFIILTVLLITTGLGYIAYKKGIFQTEQTFTLSSRTGDGLTVGMPLIFSGFKIGKIYDLELSEQGIVLVMVRVPSQHFKWLRSDSRFILERPLIGSPKLVVVTTNMNSAPLSPKAVPAVTEVNDINETIRKFEPLLAKVALIMDHVEEITASLADKKSLIEMAVGDQESVNAVYSALKNTRAITEGADGLLKKTDAALYGPDGLLKKTDAALYGADGLLKKTDAALYGQDGIQPAIVKVLQELVANLQKVGKTLDNVTKISAEAVDSTKDLKLLRSEIDGAVNSVNNLVEELNKKIPFKSEPKIRLP